MMAKLLSPLALMVNTDSAERLRSTTESPDPSSVTGSIVGTGVALASGVAVDTFVAVGAGVLVGPGVFVGAGVSVGPGVGDGGTGVHVGITPTRCPTLVAMETTHSNTIHAPTMITIINQKGVCFFGLGTSAIVDYDSLTRLDEQTSYGMIAFLEQMSDYNKWFPSRSFYQYFTSKP